jgi:hypothetical protein
MWEIIKTTFALVGLLYTCLLAKDLYWYRRFKH